VSCFDAGNRNPNNSAANLAGRQWGVLDTDELRACGLSAGAVMRRRRSGILHLIYPGVYAWGHDGLTIRGRCLAAVKACGAGAALSNRAAVALWGLLGWDEDEIPHVTVPTSYGRKIPGIIVHRTRVPFKIVRFDSIPVTTPARALIDSSSALPFDLLRRAVREALALRRVTIKELIATPGHRHRHLNDIIAEGYVPTRNEFEDAVLDLIDSGGLRRPDVNKLIIVGGKRTKPDFRWPEQRLTIEADGGQWHDHPLAREDDTERQARLEANGERVIRVSWKQATFNPKQTLARIKAAGAPSLSVLTPYNVSTPRTLD
jgi:very-short-patch-repair endonuclease